MKTFRDCGLAALAVLLALAMLELGLRAAGSKFEASLYEPHPQLHAVLRPNAQGWTVKEGESFVRINSLGMRDRERLVEAAPATIRIAFLGDSMVAAQQVPLEGTMTQVLERRLSQVLVKAGRNVEVLNFAVGGYALSQFDLALEERVWRFRPDIVAVCVSGLTVPNSNRRTKSLDDIPLFTLDGGRLVPDPGNRPPAGTSEESRRWHRILGDLHNRSRILQLVRAAQQSNWRNAFVLSKAAVPVAAEPKPAEFMRVWPYRPPDDPELAKAWQITEAILSRMVASAREHGAEFWLIQIGNDIEEDPRDAEREQFLRINALNDFKYASERYAAFAARNGVSFLYLAPPMRDYSARTGAPLRGFFNTKPYEGHWNEAGNFAAASVIAKELLRSSQIFASLKPDSNGE